MTDIASLGLEIRSDSVPQASNRLKEFRKEAGLAEGAAGSLKRLATMGLAALAAGFAAFGVGIHGAVKRMEEMDRLSRQVDQTIRNTGNLARTSSAEIAAWADQQEELTGRQAEDIMAVAANLTTFGFERQAFFRALSLGDDMSAAWGGDLKQNLEGLARALAEPEKGLAMLTKRGITFTEEQKKMIAGFIEMNDLAGAQGIVFDALEAQVKGVAEQGFGGLTKAWHLAQKAWEDAFEDMVAGEGQARDLRESLIDLAETISSPELISAVTQFGTVFVNVLNAIAAGSVNAANNLRLITDFFANSRGDLEGLSYGGLEDKMRDIGLQRLDLTNQILESERRLSQGGAGTMFGINNGALQGNIDNARTQLETLATQENQILTMLYARDQAAGMGGTAPGAVGILPPPNVPDLPGGGGGKSAKDYADLLRGAREYIAEQQLEAQALGMTEEAASRLRYEQELLNQASADGISLSPTMRGELAGLAQEMAAAEERTRQLTEAYEFGRQTLGSFVSDVMGGLREGKTLWDAFGEAGMNALDSIADRAMAADADGEIGSLWGVAA